MYQALYRKYRPKNFDEVVGQEHITSVLKQEIASGRIGHAYLFTGSRGTGKTSCSKIIAKAVNCPHQQDGNPCGVCDICRGIDDGSILDVTEIDAASNNGVDNIRQLREEANFTPAVTNYRVYIIDETHMLSTGAFNALLKIMEEPPEHVIFILATTEVHKIPATILSRCQRFDFKRISPQVIAQRVIEVCQRENIDIQLPAAELIGRLAEGGMRDALSLLDVCRSSSEQITVEQVRQSAGLAVSDSLFAIGDAVLAQDIPAVLQEIDRMFANSVDFEKMCVQLISHYRGLMMAKALKDPENFVPGLSQDKEALTKQASRYSMGQILYSLTVLQDTLSRMGKTTQTRTELEMAVIRLTNPASDRSLDLPRSDDGKSPQGPRKFCAGTFPGQRGFDQTSFPLFDGTDFIFADGASRHPFPHGKDHPNPHRAGNGGHPSDQSGIRPFTRRHPCPLGPAGNATQKRVGSSCRSFGKSGSRIGTGCIQSAGCACTAYCLCKLRCTCGPTGADGQQKGSSPV